MARIAQCRQAADAIDRLFNAIDFLVLKFLEGRGEQHLQTRFKRSDGQLTVTRALALQLFQTLRQLRLLLPNEVMDRLAHRAVNRGRSSS